MIADIINIKKLNLIVTGLFTRDSKLYISINFITQLYFKVQKEVCLGGAHFFIMSFEIKESFNKSQ